MYKLTALALLLVACGASQNEPRGKVFCESYADQYLGQCRQKCEESLDSDDQAGTKECEALCTEELKSDDTYSDDCT